MFFRIKRVSSDCICEKKERETRIAAKRQKERQPTPALSLFPSPGICAPRRAFMVLINKVSRERERNPKRLFLSRCRCRRARPFPPEKLRHRRRLLPRRGRHGIPHGGNHERDRKADAANDERPRDDGLLFCFFWSEEGKRERGGEGGELRSLCRGREKEERKTQRRWPPKPAFLVDFAPSFQLTCPSPALLLAGERAQRDPLATLGLTRCIQYRMNDMMRNTEREASFFFFFFRSSFASAKK